jgi:hypothetical protein
MFNRKLLHKKDQEIALLKEALRLLYTEKEQLKARHLQELQVLIDTLAIVKLGRFAVEERNYWLEMMVKG